MPRNASGTYSLPESAFVSGTVIRSSPVNNDLSDIATALTQSLATTGVSSMTGPIKAASGSLTAPSITFSSALGTGLYLSGTNEFAWVANGVLGATFKADLSVTWVGSATYTGNLTVNGTFTTGATTFSGTTDPILTVINTTNDALEHEIVRYRLGSGVTTASRRAIGSGANNITELRDYIGAVKAFAITSNGITLAGYQDVPEITAPSAPAANFARLYAVDEAGTTNYAWQDSAGVISGLRAATQAEMEAASSVLRTVSPGRQHFHPGHPKAGGNLNGTGTPAFVAGDYGMGAVTDNGTGDYTPALDTAFANTDYWVNGFSRDSSAAVRANVLTAPDGGTKTASTFQIQTFQTDNNLLNDSSENGITFWGDYA